MMRLLVVLLCRNTHKGSLRLVFYSVSKNVTAESIPGPKHLVKHTGGDEPGCGQGSAWTLSGLQLQ